MNHKKTIICLANSRKTGGFCIAGKECINEMPWVRPISHRHTHELSFKEQQYQDGSSPQLLDILEISIDKYLPAPHQKENYLIDINTRWIKKDRMQLTTLLDWLDTPETLWSLGESSYSKINDRLSSLTQFGGESLYLISVNHIALHVGPKSNFMDAKWGIRGKFIFNQNEYMLDVTDPIITDKYRNYSNGIYVIHHPLLCISLSDQYRDGYYYKLIAAIHYEESYL